MKELLYRPIEIPNPFPACRNGLRCMWGGIREFCRDMRAEFNALPWPRWCRRTVRVSKPFVFCWNALRSVFQGIREAWHDMRTALNALPWPAWLFKPVRMRYDFLVPIPSVDIPLLRSRKVCSWYDRLYVAGVIVAIGYGIHYSHHSAWEFASVDQCLQRAATYDMSSYPSSEPWTNPRSATVEVMTRWDDIQASMKSAAEDQDEVDGVYATARQKMTDQMWPKVAWRGWVNGNPVWIIKAVWPVRSFEAPNTPLAGWNHKTLVIDANAPYAIQGEETDNSPG